MSSATVRTERLGGIRSMSRNVRVVDQDPANVTVAPAALTSAASRGRRRPRWTTAVASVTACTVRIVTDQFGQENGTRCRRHQCGQNVQDDNANACDHDYCRFHSTASRSVSGTTAASLAVAGKRVWFTSLSVSEQLGWAPTYSQSLSLNWPGHKIIILLLPVLGLWSRTTKSNNIVIMLEITAGRRVWNY